MRLTRSSCQAPPAPHSCPPSCRPSRPSDPAHITRSPQLFSNMNSYCPLSRHQTTRLSHATCPQSTSASAATLPKPRSLLPCLRAGGCTYVNVVDLDLLVLHLHGLVGPLHGRHGRQRVLDRVQREVRLPPHPTQRAPHKPIVSHSTPDLSLLRIQAALRSRSSQLQGWLDDLVEAVLYLC